MEGQGPFVTGMARVRVDRSGRLANGEAGETWLFVWSDFDNLIAHLRHLVRDPDSRFGVADMLWMMAEARRQMRDARRQWRSPSGTSLRRPWKRMRHARTSH